MRKLASLLVGLVVLSACSTIDCPLNNIVMGQWKLSATLGDTLTVSTVRGSGSDTVLLNRAVAVDSFALPMSYSQEEDIYYVQISHPTETTPLRTIDTVRVSKRNYPHFESVDCSPSMFHEILGVKTTHHRIDSIVINHKDVTYDTHRNHFLIYLQAAAD